MLTRQRRKYEFEVIMDEDEADIAAFQQFKKLRARAYGLGATFSSKYGASATLRTYIILISAEPAVLDAIETEYTGLRKVEPDAPNAPIALNHLER